MAWIEANGKHINLDLVRSFWWERHDTFTATLYLEYSDGYVEEIPDPYRVKHMSLCVKTGQPTRMG